MIAVFYICECTKNDKDLPILFAINFSSQIADWYAILNMEFEDLQTKFLFQSYKLIYYEII